MAETHISIHTWPEQRFAAVDIFVCGKNGCSRERLDGHLQAFWRAGD
ncbi:S-adenosylmethionine decarboxylase [Novosphingobium panipatense]|nr:S-adenosylmethionine decarboxylase [Novosphingobium sp. HII-3]